MSPVRQNRRTERSNQSRGIVEGPLSIRRLIKSYRESSRLPRRSFMRRLGGSRESHLEAFIAGFLESEPDWRFARNDVQCVPGRLAKSASPGRARAHESSPQENGRTAVSEGEGN